MNRAETASGQTGLASRSAACLKPQRLPMRIIVRLRKDRAPSLSLRQTMVKPRSRADNRSQEQSSDSHENEILLFMTSIESFYAISLCLLLLKLGISLVLGCCSLELPLVPWRLGGSCLAPPAAAPFAQLNFICPSVIVYVYDIDGKDSRAGRRQS